MSIVTALPNLIGFIQHRLNRQESGASMVEYALFVAPIASGCIAILAFLGTSVSNLFGGVSNQVCGVATSGGAAGYPSPAVPPS